MNTETDEYAGADIEALEELLACLQQQCRRLEVAELSPLGREVLG